VVLLQLCRAQTSLLEQRLSRRADPANRKHGKEASCHNTVIRFQVNLCGAGPLET
jgi:hypothetical protein